MLKDARVLLVDDHFDLADNVREILEEEGASVMHAATAAQALQLAPHPRQALPPPTQPVQRWWLRWPARPLPRLPR